MLGTAALDGGWERGDPVDDSATTDDLVEDARRCAVGLLRDLASTLERAPASLAAEALLALSNTLVELEKVSERVLPSTGTDG
jgi:hypothetical protein